MASFISTNVFETKAKVRREKQKILTWLDLPQNHIYQITEVEFVEDGKFGPAHILFLTDKDNLYDLVFEKGEKTISLFESPPSSPPSKRKK